MNITSILDLYHTTQTISEEIISSIQSDKNLRRGMVNFFADQHKDRKFASALLSKFIDIRKQPGSDTPCEYLMFACYILGLHNYIEDSIKIWEAKSVDFDTYCGLDIQLVAFAGAQKTLDFFKEKGLTEAYDYLIECVGAGDLNPNYFDLNNLPWYI